MLFFSPSRRPLRDGLSLRDPRQGRTQGRPPRRRPLRDGLSLRGANGGDDSDDDGRGRRPLRDGLSLRDLRQAGHDRIDVASPSFTGRPFIEGLDSAARIRW